MDTASWEAVGVIDIRARRVRQACKDEKAITLADGSTGVHVSGNRVNSRIGKLITFDDEDVANGYVGPHRTTDRRVQGWNVVQCRRRYQRSVAVLERQDGGDAADTVRGTIKGVGGAIGRP
jgi:hypothetical protein